MQKLVVLLLISIIGLIECFAQNEEGIPHYLFDKFQDGIVYYKDGRQFRVPLNYNFAYNRFLYIDKNDNDIIKEFGEPELVSLIKVGNRTFLHDPKEVKEILQLDPPILVQYRSTVKDKGKKSAYGGYSQTSAITSYSGWYTDGTFHPFNSEEDKSIILSRITNIYYVDFKNKKKRFSTEKEFLKIYSQHKDNLKKYIKANHIDFDSTQQVIKLNNYAVSLYL